MALIRDRHPTNVSGGYERLLGNAEVGELFSKIQGAVISSGHELARLIEMLTANIDDLDAFLRQEIMQEGVKVAPRRQIKQCETLHFLGKEPSFMVFRRDGRQQRCYLIELNDGHVFDTTKASAERRVMHGFIERNAEHIPYEFSSHFCAFNQTDRQAIWDGFKRKISIDEAMTGPEFCALLNLDHAAIVEARRQDGPENMEYVLTELLKIDPVRDRLTELLG